MSVYVNGTVRIQKEDEDTIFTVTIVGELLRQIHTTVTSSGHDVEDWLNTIYGIHYGRLNRLIVGFDVEWRPSTIWQCNNPVALIQLCIGNRCLIFQIIHADYIPNALNNFLEDNRFSFVGVGIDADVEKLIEHYHLRVRNPVDLRNLAVDTLGRRDLQKAGLKVLAKEVAGLDVEKPKVISWSQWDNYALTNDQVKYACVDAFLSFEIGRSLIAMTKDAGGRGSCAKVTAISCKIFLFLFLFLFLLSWVAPPVLIPSVEAKDSGSLETKSRVSYNTALLIGSQFLVSACPARDPFERKT